MQRYSKFKKLLPKAEADLQQELDKFVGTPPGERQQLLLDINQELKEMAAGGEGGSCSGHPHAALRLSGYMMYFAKDLAASTVLIDACHHFKCASFCAHR